MKVFLYKKYRVASVYERRVSSMSRGLLSVQRVMCTATSVSLAIQVRYSRSEVRLDSQWRKPQRTKGSTSTWSRRRTSSSTTMEEDILILCFQVLLSRSSTLSILQTQLRSTFVSHLSLAVLSSKKN